MAGIGSIGVERPAGLAATVNAARPNRLKRDSELLPSVRAVNCKAYGASEAAYAAIAIISSSFNFATTFFINAAEVPL